MLSVLVLIGLGFYSVQLVLGGCVFDRVWSAVCYLILICQGLYLSWLLLVEIDAQLDILLGLVFTFVNDEAW